MKKTKKFAWMLGILAASSIPCIALTSISCSKSSGNYVDFSQPSYSALPELNYNPYTQPKKPNLNYNDVLNDGLYSIGTYDSKIIGTANRPEQTNIYNSQAYAKYHDAYGFEYPSQEYDYKKLATEQPGRISDLILENKNNPSDTISAFDAVLDEFVVDENGNPITLIWKDPNTEKEEKFENIRFSDPKWIIQEIANGQLRKHRAAINMYRNKIDNINAVKKQFTISTATKGSAPLGLFAPAGEVVNIEFDEATWELLNKNKGTFDVVLSQNLWNNYSKDNSGRPSNRYPYVRTVFSLNDLITKESQATRTIKIGSPFGGGISFYIHNTLKDDQKFFYDSPAISLNFTVNGAVPCMFYQDGVTTESEWNQQKQDVKENKLAPILQAIAPYYSMEIPFNDLNTIGGRPVSDLIYPKNNFKKWNDFLYLSNYLAGNDLKNSIRRLDMEFCDDIWGSAAAWGGGMRFYCPTPWGVNSFFYKTPAEVFNAGDSWGVFHEINHNFQLDLAFFNKRTHGETNQTSAFDLSVISDVTHSRSEINWSGESLKQNTNTGWQYLDTPYSIIKNLLDKEEKAENPTYGEIVDEYPIYSLLLFWMGSKNYADYVREDVIHHPSNASDWTGMKEIQKISEQFKINMWPAFKDYGRLWNDWKEDATIAKSLEKYKAMDFVANQYACGSYLYNNDTNQYIYPGDTLPAFEIPAGSNYTLRLDEMIASINKSFNWTNVQWTNPKYGTLEKDTNNSKRLIYKPKIQNIGDIDEFDLTITPGNWNGKPSNYVSEYKFKVKIRQVIDRPILETFNIELPESKDPNKEDLFAAIENATPEYRTPIDRFVTPIFSDPKRRGARIKFKFIAPKDGTYVFAGQYDDFLKVKVNGKVVHTGNAWQPKFTKVYQVNLKQGESLNFDNIFINNTGAWNFNFKAGFQQTVSDLSHVNDSKYKEINIIDNSIMFDAENILPNIEFTKILIDPKYKYKPREINRSVFIASLSDSINLSNYSNPSIINATTTTVDKDGNETNEVNYTFSTEKQNIKNSIKNLGDYTPGTYCEDWKVSNDNPFEFEINFTNPTNVTTLYFGHRTNNHPKARATDVVVTGYTSDTDTTGTEMYNGKYGAEFDDRNSSLSCLNLTTPKRVTKLKVSLKNSLYEGCILQWVRIGTRKYIPFGTQFGLNNPLMSLSNNWIVRNNDDDNSSGLNNMYFLSEKSNNEITFTLENSNGFALIGQENNFGGQFDVYIDNVLKQTVNVNSSRRVDNAKLYEYYSDIPKTIKVRIVTKSNSKLYLNYIMTFGKSTYLSKNK